jgi:uncharacterized OsmC-like protein
MGCTMGPVHQKTTKLMNGIDVDKLQGTIDAIGKDPDLALFSFRAVNEWVDGAQTKTTVEDLNAGNKTITHRQPFVIRSDEPEVLVGGDTAPNAIVSLLHALASCLSVSIVYNAAMREIPIDSLSITVEGDVDVHGFLGLSKEVRPGFQDVRVEVELKTDASRARVEELVNYAQKVSPVLDSLRNRIPVEVSVKA